jgi:hypothetical protein
MWVFSDCGVWEGKGGRRTHVDGRKEQLIACYSRDDGAVLGVKVDVLGEQAVPLGRRGTEDDYASDVSFPVVYAD